jgi:hypothetical protein
MPEAGVAAAAGALFRQYGADGAVIATLRAAEEAARGDMAASDHWLAVAQLIEAMTEPGAATPPGCTTPDA